MDWKRRARLAFAGALLFGVFGSALGGFVIGTIGFLPQILSNLRSSPTAVVGGLGLLSFCMLVAVVFAGPFGLLVGGAFGWWQAGRLASGISRQRLLRECALIGAILGAAYPLFFNTAYPMVIPEVERLRSGPVLLFAATGGAVGMICGLALARSATTKPPLSAG